MQIKKPSDRWLFNYSFIQIFYFLQATLITVHNGLAKVKNEKEIVHGRTIVKSISTKRREPKTVKTSTQQKITSTKNKSNGKNKTTENDSSVAAYLKAIVDETKRKDCSAIIALVTKQTGIEPKMWGPAIVGFDSYHYKYESGREGDAPLAGLAARANTITLYLGSSFDKREELLAKFGKHKTGEGCIYIQKLADVDIVALISMFKNCIAGAKKKYSA